MKVSKKLIVFFILLFSFNANAFDWKKCKEILFAGGNGVGILLSTTSFASSTTECSAFGSIENQKKIFIVYNFEMFKSDSARGGGEYVTAYAELNGCRKGQEHFFSRKLKSNFREIFGDDKVKDSKEVYESIEVLMRRDRDILRVCNTFSS